MPGVPILNPNPPLSLEELAVGIWTVWENAASLLQDAELLFHNGSFPRSVSLCILAQEEVSKILLIIQLLYVGRNGKDPLATFYKKFVNHEPKTVEFLCMHCLNDVLHEGGEHTKKMLSDTKTQVKGSTFTETKERGFYVEFDRGVKKFSSPSDAINQQMAADFLSNVKKYFSIYNQGNKRF